MGLCVLAGVLLRDDAWIAVMGIVLAADAIVGVAVGRLADTSQRDRIVAPMTAQSMRAMAAFSCFFSAFGVGITVIAIGPGWRDYGAIAILPGLAGLVIQFYALLGLPVVVVH